MSMHAGTEISVYTYVYVYKYTHDVDTSMVSSQERILIPGQIEVERFSGLPYIRAYFQAAHPERPQEPKSPPWMRVP